MESYDGAYIAAAILTAAILAKSDKRDTQSAVALFKETLAETEKQFKRSHGKPSPGATP
jgi:hypothetical protein